MRAIRIALPQLRGGPVAGTSSDAPNVTIEIEDGGFDVRAPDVDPSPFEGCNDEGPTAYLRAPIGRESPGCNDGT